jgi:hypothetical protein
MTTFATDAIHLRFVEAATQEGGSRIKSGMTSLGNHSILILGSARSFANSSVIAQTIASARSGLPGPW